MRSVAKNLARKFYTFALGVELVHRLDRDGSPEPKVLYAGQAPVPGAPASGGAVKLLSLTGRYPEGIRHGNILYLVSSAFPRGVEAWVSVAKRKGIHVVLNQNGVAYPAWATPGEMTRYNTRNRFIIEQADYVIFQSRFCKEAVDRWVGGRASKSTILHNPISIGAFQPRVELNRTNGIAKLLLMGSHRHSERVILALEALAVLRSESYSAELRIAGPLAWPFAADEVRAKISELGLEHLVTLSGSYLPNAAAGIYREGDILVHLQDKDASPTVPLEAMACGLSVVAPKSGGIPELVPPEFGELIPVAEDWNRMVLPAATEIAHAIRRLGIPDPARRAAAHRHVAENFSESAWIERHSEIFREVLRS